MTYDKAFEWFDAHVDWEDMTVDEMLTEMEELFGKNGSTELYEELLNTALSERYGEHEAERATEQLSVDIMEAGERSRTKASQNVDRRKSHARAHEIVLTKKRAGNVLECFRKGSGKTLYKSFKDLKTGRFISKRSASARTRRARK